MMEPTQSNVDFDKRSNRLGVGKHSVNLQWQPIDTIPIPELPSSVEMMEKRFPIAIAYHLKYKGHGKYGLIGVFSWDRVSKGWRSMSGGIDILDTDKVELDGWFPLPED